MEWTIGLVVGIIIALIIALLIRKLRKKQNYHYDEMQLKLRGDGYKIGFITMVVCSLAYAIIDDLVPFSVFSTSFALFLILFIGITIFIIFCLVKEAFFSIGQNGKKYLVLCIILVALNLWAGVDTILRGEFLVDHQVTFSSGGNLVTGCAFLIVTIVIIVKMLRAGGENEES